jgi:OPT family oligopeptide transporter
MAILELSEEQVRTMSLEEKDKWWLANVYKGDMPQLNFRSAVTGMLLGGVLSLTNIYIGSKTGWTLGVGISSVILSFAIFKVFSQLGIGKEMTVLENNAMQSVATSAGYMTAPLTSSIPAYMLVTGHTIPMMQTMMWIIVLSLLGVLFAFPLKKRFINEEQLPFPEGYAAGVVMDNLHTGTGTEGVFKAKLLAYSGGISALIETMRSEKVMGFLKLKVLTLPEYWDDFVYKFWTPGILGTPLKDLTIQWDSSIVMMATGGLMGISTALSLLLGAFINYFILAPIMIREGVIHGGGFKAITMWALWGGVALMTTSSLYSFFSKPQILLSAFRFNKKDKSDVLKDIELPMKVFVIGIPVMGAITIAMGHVFFGIHWYLGLIAIPLVSIFTLIAVNSTGLTSITPGGAIGKLTQLSFSVIAPGNIPTNIMTAGITGEVALNASNLLMDIKPGYMLGGKPRHQAVGHVLGIFAGAFVAVPVYYMLFHGDLSILTSDRLPMPGAQIWRAVAEVLTKGLSFLHPTAKIAVVVGAVIGIVLEMIKSRRPNFRLSGVGLGLAFVLRFNDSLAMALGALLFWYFERKYSDVPAPESAGAASAGPRPLGYRVWVENREAVCAGAIAGGSIIGLILILLETAL